MPASRGSRRCGIPLRAGHDAGPAPRKPAPTTEQLTALAAKASTPADHRGLEEYFLTLAKRHTADANDHAMMARTYRGTKIAQAAAHCDHMVMLLRDSAKEATAAAELHKSLAGIAR